MSIKKKRNKLEIYIANYIIKKYVLFLRHESDLQKGGREKNYRVYVDICMNINSIFFYFFFKQKAEM